MKNAMVALLVALGGCSSWSKGDWDAVGDALTKEGDRQAAKQPKTVTCSESPAGRTMRCN